MLFPMSIKIMNNILDLKEVLKEVLYSQFHGDYIDFKANCSHPIELKTTILNDTPYISN